MVNKRERMRASFYQLKRDLFNQQLAALNSYNGYESKDLEAIKNLHHYNDSLYDRPIDVIKTAKYYENKWAEDDDAQVIDVGNIKDVLDFNLTLNSDVLSASSNTTLTASASNSIHEFLFSKKVNQKQKSNLIKSKPSKSMIHLPLQDTKNKTVAKVKKRKSKWECYGNPYAKPTYKSFAWMLGVRKKRKLSESANDAREVHNIDDNVNDENKNSIARDDHDGMGSSGGFDGDVNVKKESGVNINLKEIDKLSDEINLSDNEVEVVLVQKEPASAINFPIQKYINKNTRYMRYKNLKSNEVLQDVKNTDEKCSNEIDRETQTCQKVPNDLEKTFGKLSRIVKLGKRNNSRVNCMKISQTENERSKSPSKRDSNDEDEKEDKKFYNGLKRPGLFDSTHVFNNNNISDHTTNSNEVSNSNNDDFEKDDLKRWSEWNRSILNGIKATKAASKKKDSKRRKIHLTNGFNRNDYADSEEVKNKFSSNNRPQKNKYKKVDPNIDKTLLNHTNNLNSTIKDKNSSKKLKNKKNNKLWSSEKKITIKKSDGEDDKTIDILEVDNDNSRSSLVDFEDEITCNLYESSVKVQQNITKSNNNVSNVKNLEKNKFMKSLSKNKKSLDNIRSIQVTLDTFIKNNKIPSFLDDGSKRELNNAVSDKITPSKSLSPLKGPECLLAIKPNKAQRNNNFNDKIKSPFDHKINNDNISPVFSKNHLNEISKKNRKVNENKKILKNEKLINKNKLLIKKKISYLLENNNSNIHKYLKSKTLSDKLKAVP